MFLHFCCWKYGRRVQETNFLIDTISPLTLHHLFKTSARSSICIFIILCLFVLPCFLPPLFLCLFVSFIRLLMGRCFPADCLSKTTSAFSVSTAATVTHWNAKCRETPQKVKKIGFPKTSTFCTKRAGPWRVNCITTNKNRGFDGEKRKEVVKSKHRWTMNSLQRNCTTILVCKWKWGIKRATYGLHITADELAACTRLISRYKIWPDFPRLGQIRAPIWVGLP